MVTQADVYRVIENPSLSARTSIGLGGEAIAEVSLYSVEGLEQLPGLLARIGGKIRVLGEGSNIIAQDGKLPYVLVNFDKRADPAQLNTEGETVYVRVDAGVRLPALLAWAARVGLTGLESLAGIPGNVGGALAMNAGSFGVEIWSLVRGVQLFSPNLGIVERQAEDFELGYRHCALCAHQGWFLFTAATMALRKAPPQIVRDSLREIFLKKQSVQPITAKSAGCVFKNPGPGLSAGRLLDEAGLRGFRLGNMCFSSLHANFLVNEGGGTFAQAMELINLAKEKVLAHSGHELCLEACLWQ